MNKSKLPMPARLRKKMKKEIRSAMPEFEQKVTSDDINPKALLSRLPAKLRKKETSLLASFDKTVKIKKKKRFAKHSKRTTPGFVDQKSSPQIIHIEGGRWMQTIKKQNLTQNRIINRKMAKKKR